MEPPMVPLNNGGDRQANSVLQDNLIIEKFYYFLHNISKHPPPKFNICDLETGSATCKVVCATNMLESAISHPEYCLGYAIALQKIEISEENFIEQLNEVCEKEIDEIIATRTSDDSTRIKNIGTFLSHLYVRDISNTQLMVKWLKHTQTLAREGESAAAKSLFAVLKTVLSKMESRDLEKFNSYVLFIKLFAAHGRIPLDFLKWSQEITEEGQGRSSAIGSPINWGNAVEDE